MLTLSLLRHAKSSWKSASLSDHERPLNARGKADAPLMGKAIAEHGLSPDLVLCSTARRTRDTFYLVLPQLKAEPRVIYEDGLYHPEPEEMLAILREAGGVAASVLMVGHNPELQSLTLDLIGSGPKQLKDRIEAKYPTAGLVAMRFPAAAWKDVTLNSGKLELFLAPRDVADE